MNFYIIVIVCVFVFPPSALPGQESVPGGVEEPLQVLMERLSKNKEKKPELALDAGRKALGVLRVLPHTGSDIKVRLDMCWAFIQLGNYTEAIQAAEMAEKSARLINDDISVATAYKFIGFVYNNKSDYQQALSYSLKALAIFEQLKEKVQISSAHTFVGDIYRRLKKFDPALRHHNEAMRIAANTGDENTVNRCLNNIGSVYKDKGDTSKAIEYYSRLLKRLEGRTDHDSRMRLAVGLANMALTRIVNRQPEKAFAYLERARAIYTENGIRLKSAYVHAYTAFAHRKMKHYPPALAAVKKALDIGDELGAKTFQSACHKERSDIYREMGRYKAALDSYTLYKKISDSVLDERKNQAIADLELKYETHKKEKAIELLTKNNSIQQLALSRKEQLQYFLMLVTFLVIIIAVVTYSRFLTKRKSARELAVSEAQLKKSNAAKDRLFTIIAHDLSSPLNSLLLSSDLLAADYDSLQNGEVKEFIDNIHNQGLQVSALLGNLLEWSRTQLGKMVFRPRSLEVEDVVEDAADHVRFAAEKKEIRLEIHPNTTTAIMADEHMLNAVLRNLLCNAVKFTASGGTITLKGEAEGGGVRLSVSDSGVGMPAGQMEQLQHNEPRESKQGTAGEKGTGLGLMICREFILKHNSKLEIESQAGKGSRFSFLLPGSQKFANIGEISAEPAGIRHTWNRRP
ncbi:MAG: tetratricopeptide repeat protein [bacterium]|nr:tetratricopeptide repeat protein [bacterium]